MDRGSGGQVLCAGDEVRDTGQEAHVTLDADGLQGLGQGDQPSARDNLTSAHQRTIAAVQRAHVTLDVGITNDVKTKRQGRRFPQRFQTENGRRKQLKTIPDAAKIWNLKFEISCLL